MYLLCHKTNFLLLWYICIRMSFPVPDFQYHQLITSWLPKGFFASFSTGKSLHLSCWNEIYQGVLFLVDTSSNRSCCHPGNCLCYYLLWVSCLLIQCIHLENSQHVNHHCGNFRLVIGKHSTNYRYWWFSLPETPVPADALTTLQCHKRRFWEY